MNSDPLVLHLQSDLLGNIIAYAADIQKCSKNITTQIREIIAARVVGLFMRQPDSKYRLLAACPERNSSLLGEEKIQPLMTLAANLNQATLIEPGKGEIGLLLADLGMRESFVLPLRVEGESFGMLILLDLLDTKGIDKIFEALQDISGLLSLVFKNSYLYSNMESLVEQRTRALRASELRSQIILQSAMDGFWCLDPQGKILEVNDSYCRMSGYSRRELLQMNLMQLEAQESPEEIADKSSRVLSGQSAYFETVHRRKDGTLFSLEIYSQMLAGSDGKEMFAFLRDISERKRNEKEKAILQSQLQHAQKMEAIGTLAGGIAHDFNNILGAILGYAELALEDCPAGSVLAGEIAQIQKAGNRAKDLVKQILTFSRQAEAKDIILYPGTIIKEALKMLRASLPATIAIKEDIAADVGPIQADATNVHQIIMNLCTNAYHAMEERGGTLSVGLKTTSLAAGELLHEPHVRPGPFMHLTVADTGTGIAPEIGEKIFDPYFTTKEIGKGTGMGLAIIHGIVKSRGGALSYHSQVGSGTVFHVLLPIVDEPACREDPSAAVAGQGSEHILLIDDEEMLVEMGRHMLERLGYRVTTRQSSIEALTTFQNQPQSFHLVITDQTMPFMTGSDLARRMLQIRPDLPIILCTGYSSIISAEKARSLGIRGFALKPLVKKDIGRLIREVLDGTKNIYSRD